MTASSNEIAISDFGTEIRAVGQQLVPFKIPLGFPLVNPFSKKQMHFRKEYKVTGVTLDEAVTGVLFGRYHSFMDVKRETYNRRERTRNLVFNPFTIELEHLGAKTGEMGAAAGRSTASLIGAGLGLIEWNIWVEPTSTADKVSLHFKTTNDMFSGHFRINATKAPDGVILEDDWTPEGGADMRTSYLLMANLVLMAHPKGFEQIAGNFVEEVQRARMKGVPYRGEIGPPSVEED
ncbi:MAG: hypothetical protein WCG92_20890 [Hyphomicrobiales bacterium]